MYGKSLFAWLMFIPAAPALAQEPVPLLAPGEALLQVSGTGKVLAVPDVATIETGVIADGATPDRAVSANADAAERLVAALRSAGVPEKSIRTAAVRVGPRYRQDKGGDDTAEVIGYRATNRLTVRMVQAARAGEVIDVLAKGGATEISGPDFSFADDAPLIASARSAAVVKAERQAKDYAAALGLKTLRLVRVSERAMDVPVGGEIVVTGMRRTPVHAGEQPITVTVWIDYAVLRSAAGEGR